MNARLQTFAAKTENQVKVKRYQELAERLFLKTITLEEAEMQRLSAELERETAPFYAPIRARMEALAHASETAP